MPKPTPDQLNNLGELVQPFERTGFKRKVLEGEALKIPFLPSIYDATDNNYPENVLRAAPQNILNGEAELAKYLWIISTDGLVIIPEQTPNQNAARGVVCHTNLTEGKAAIQGGELWFGEDDVVYINNKSGRYGATTLKEREAILEYFQSVGYKNIEQIR